MLCFGFSEQQNRSKQTSSQASKRANKQTNKQKEAATPHSWRPVIIIIIIMIESRGRGKKEEAAAATRTQLMFHPDQQLHLRRSINFVAPTRANQPPNGNQAPHYHYHWSLAIGVRLLAMIKAQWRLSDKFGRCLWAEPQQQRGCVVLINSIDRGLCFLAPSQHGTSTRLKLIERTSDQTNKGC